jgi:nucleoside-diphosphate-sugar epimerase
MKVLLIGGAGYFGIEITKRFVKDQIPVNLIDKMIYGNYENIPVSEKLTFIDDDVLNIEKYFVVPNEYEDIIYLASPRLSDVNSIEIVNEELERLKKTIEVVNKFKNDSQTFYFISSCSVYGKNSNIVNENSELIETSLYSKLKIESEKLILEQDDRFKIFRMATIYGHSEFERDDILINSIIKDIKNNKKIEIFDPESSRPHIHMRDAVEMIRHFTIRKPKERIINIGPLDGNKTKRQIIDSIKKVLKFDFDVEYIESNDSRDYKVDFSLLHTNYLNNTNGYHHRFFNFEESIYDLYVGQMNFTHEDWDTILNYYRPNGSSKTWYLEEEGKVSLPKMWGEWNIIDEETKSMFDTGYLKNQIHPPFRDRNVKWVSKKDIKNQKHIYLIPTYAPSFFLTNKKIGFKCISQKFLTDVREGRAKIVIYHIMEGYSGMTGNTDLEILNKWIIDAKLPAKNVYYIHGNLKVGEIAKSRGYKFKCIGVSTFDNWLDARAIPSHCIPFKICDNKFLYLSYNRNQRTHRISFCSALLENNLLDKGKVSAGWFDREINNGVHPWVHKLYDIVPIEIDKTIDFNLANDITFSNFESTFVSVVTETHVDKDILFFSEKIWKPIYVGHPFIIYGNPETLKKLKELGFRTFEKWWDESYDLEYDETERMYKIMDILNYLNTLTEYQLVEIREQMTETVEWNQHVYRETITKKYNLDGNFFVSEVPMLKLLADIYYDKI